MRSCGLAFVPVELSQAVLDTSPDSVASPIDEVACRAFRILARLVSCVLDLLRDFLQASFTAQ